MYTRLRSCKLPGKRPAIVSPFRPLLPAAETEDTAKMGRGVLVVAAAAVAQREGREQAATGRQ